MNTISVRFACAGAALLLASCTSAVLPGADDTLEQTDEAYQVQAESDLRNAATAEEAYFAQNGSYTTDLAAIGFSSSGATSVSAPQAAGTDFCLEAVHTNSGSTWHLRKTEAAVQPGPC